MFQSRTDVLCRASSPWTLLQVSAIVLTARSTARLWSGVRCDGQLSLGGFEAVVVQVSKQRRLGYWLFAPVD